MKGARAATDVPRQHGVILGIVSAKNYTAWRNQYQRKHGDYETPRRRNYFATSASISFARQPETSLRMKLDAFLSRILRESRKN